MRAKFNYAHCLFDLGRYDDAAAEFETLLKSRYGILGYAHAESLNTAILLVESLRRAEKTSNALEVLEDVYAHREEIRASLRWQNSAQLHRLVNCYSELDRPDRAAALNSIVCQLFSSASDKEFHDPDFVAKLGYSVEILTSSRHPELHDPRWAIELATKFCEATEFKNPESVGMLAVAYADKEDFDAAAKWFDKAVELQPNNIKFQYFRALAHLRSGDAAGYRAACAAILKQGANSPNDEERNLITWTCGFGPAATDDLQLPLKIAKEISTKAPDNLAFLMSLGAMHYRTRENEEAAKRLSESIGAFDKAGSESTSSIYPQFFLAMTKWKLGDKAEAMRLFAEAQTRMDQEMKTSPSWSRRATLELLQREAKALLSETAARDSVSAPLRGPAD